MARVYTLARSCVMAHRDKSDKQPATCSFTTSTTVNETIDRVWPCIFVPRVLSKDPGTRLHEGCDQFHAAGLTYRCVVDRDRKDPRVQCVAMWILRCCGWSKSGGPLINVSQRHFHSVRAKTHPFRPRIVPHQRTAYHGVLHKFHRWGRHDRGNNQITQNGPSDGITLNLS